MAGGSGPRGRRSSLRALLHSRAVVVLGAALALVTVRAATGPTSAAWTEPAYFTAAASSGSWVGASPFGTCTVVTMAGVPVVGRTCTVTGLVYVDFGDGKPVGQRTGHMNLTLATDSRSDGSEQVRLDLRLAAATGLWANWTWANAAVVGGNLSAYPGYTCATLTQPGAPLTAYAPGWVSTTGTAQFQVTEQRTPGKKSNYICT